LMHSFVGAGLTSRMAKVVEEFAQQPDAPNLYWALATFPRPGLRTVPLGRGPRAD
jgi:hypothetical protein